MRHIFNIFFILSLFFNIAYPQNTEELFIPNKHSSFKPKNAKLLYISYEQLPKNGYVGELIGLNIKAITPLKFERLDILDTNTSLGEIKDLSPKWDNIGENIYTKTIYFQAKRPLEKLPNFQVKLVQKNGEIKQETLPSFDINIIKLNNDEGRFINVFAKDLQVRKFKTNRFDKDNLILVLEIMSKYANIDDIHFANYKKQGIDSKSGEFPNNSAFYYIIFKEGMDKISFSYFNTTQNIFKQIDIPIILDQNDLSTQIGLNPKKSKFEFYKELGLGALSILFLILSLIRKKLFYGLIAIVLGTYLAYHKFSMKDIVAKQGAKVKILPTKNSTIFSSIKQDTKVEKLNTHGNYIKVLLPSGKIGWIQKSDIIKN